jgi:sulfite dehydrogenase
VVTPTSQLYVRNNLPTPSESIVADRDAWAVQIDGVKSPPS